MLMLFFPENQKTTVAAIVVNKEPIINPKTILTEFICLFLQFGCRDLTKCELLKRMFAEIKH